MARRQVSCTSAAPTRQWDGNQTTDIFCSDLDSACLGGSRREQSDLSENKCSRRATFSTETLLDSQELMHRKAQLPRFSSLRRSNTTTTSGNLGRILRMRMCLCLPWLLKAITAITHQFLAQVFRRGRGLFRGGEAYRLSIIVTPRLYLESIWELIESIWESTYNNTKFASP